MRREEGRSDTQTGFNFWHEPIAEPIDTLRGSCRPEVLTILVRAEPRVARRGGSSWLMILGSPSLLTSCQAWIRLTTSLHVPKPLLAWKTEVERS